MAFSVGAAAVVLVVTFTMAFVGSTPHRAMWAHATLLDFAGHPFSPPTRGAPVALYGWHGLYSVQARSECAETGLIGRSPTTLVGILRILIHGTGREAPLGERDCWNLLVAWE